MPPLPEGVSDSLKDFLLQCFQKDASLRPTAEELCEHEWLKKNWVGGKVRLCDLTVRALRHLIIVQELRQKDSIPFLRRVSTDMHKSSAGAMRTLAQLDIPATEVAPSDDGLSAMKSPGRRYSNGPASPRPSMREQDSIVPREHSFVKTHFGKRMSPYGG